MPQLRIGATDAGGSIPSLSVPAFWDPGRSTVFAELGHISLTRRVERTEGAPPQYPRRRCPVKLPASGAANLDPLWLMLDLTPEGLGYGLVSQARLRGINNPQPPRRLAPLFGDRGTNGAPFYEFLSQHSV
jgi:hypothetical protein